MRRLAACAVLAAGLATGVAAGLAFAAPAQAGDELHDRIYADSFGNLVVHSRAGYKRIVVGAGHLAAELNAYQGSGVDGSDADGYDAAPLDARPTGTVEKRCRYVPTLVKGRSYMYGLADGELPTPGRRCD